MQTYTFKQLCQFESQLAKTWKRRETLLSHDWMVLFLHSLSTLRIWLNAFVIYPENLTQCIRYLHWESDSMHSLSTVRVWLHAFVIYTDNLIPCIRYLQWESDSMHLLSTLRIIWLESHWGALTFGPGGTIIVVATHFQKLEQLCGVVCSVSVSPEVKHLCLLLPMHSSEKVIMFTFLVNSPVSKG